MNKRLKAARHKKGWSQEDAADAARVATRTYQRWEYGTHYPNFESRRFLREAFGATDEELGLDLVAYVEASQGDEQQIATPTLQELASLSDLLKGKGDRMVRFDESKRKTLQKLLTMAKAAAVAPLVLADVESRSSSPGILPSQAVGNNFDLDLVDRYTEALRGLLAKGDAQYVLHASQDLYSKLLQGHPSSRDIRLAEAQLCLGMLVGAAQEYALPWYQRDQAVMQTYNHIEDNILCKFDVSSTLQLEYARLLAKRGRQHRVLWQFEACVRECEDGLAALRDVDDYSLRTHFLVERAHIEATRGDELLWMRKLDEARRGALDMKIADRGPALSQVDYMQGEGYKRFAFHTQKDLSMSIREKYANFALGQFTQWQGATIELPGFEDLVVQVSRAQCLILVDPDEAIHLAKQLGKQAEQRYPALLDKIHRVIFLAQQRLLMGSSEFSHIFKEASQSAYHAGRNIL